MPQNESRHKKRIKDLPLASRPREKLLAIGSDNLSDEELLAILLGTGSRKQNALSLSRALLKQYPLTQLATTPHLSLRKFPGVGASKATRILATVELGRRVFAQASLSTVVVRSTQDAVIHLKDIVSKRQEYLVVLYLNARYELLRKEVVGVGSLNSMTITPKEIFSHAMQTPCASIIVAHNHPSGDPTPSDDDIVFTDRIHQAGEVMGIMMLDHIIVGTEGFFSFRDDKAVETSKN